MFGVPVTACVRAFYPFSRKAFGCVPDPAFPAPLFLSRADDPGITRASRAAGTRWHVIPRTVGWVERSEIHHPSSLATERWVSLALNPPYEIRTSHLAGTTPAATAGSAARRRSRR